MKMAAVVRVKRSLDEEPNSGFILSCKRRKTDANNEGAVETLFKFGGTVKDPDEKIALLNPNKLAKKDAKISSRPTPDISQKARVETKDSSQSNRYKLVHYFRTIGNVDLDGGEDSTKNALTVLEVEPQVPADQVDKQQNDTTVGELSTSPQYVYDLYYIESNNKDIDVDDLLLDDLVSFAPIENELVFDSYRNNQAGGEDSDTPFIDDEDDSNDENNWRNDYPDEEEDNSDDGGLACGFGKITFGDEELSSDGDDERLIYTEELPLSDVNMHGSAYAFFKQRALKEIADSDDEYNSTKSNYSSNDDDSDRDCVSE